MSLSSRADLLLALRSHIDAALDIRSSLAPIGSAPDADAAVTAWAGHVAGYHSKIAGVIRAVDQARHRDEDAAALWADSTSAWYAECRQLVRRIDAEGRLAEPWSLEHAADLLWSFMSVDFVEDLIGERGWTVEELSNRLALVVRRAIMTAP